MKDINNLPIPLEFLSENEDDALESLPIISINDDEINSQETQIEELPILPLKNTVLFPGVVIPITVSRKKSIRLVKKAYKGDKTIGVVSQSNTNVPEQPHL